MKRFAPLLLLLLAPLLIGMSKKQEFSITFHVQGTDTDMPKTIFPLTLDGRPLLFKIIPEFSQANITAFHSFPAPTGDFGVALQLDFSGRSALEILTRTRTGEYLLAMVNGQPVDYVVVDQVITNGMITIWQGVPQTVVQAMEKKYARIKPGTTPSVSDKIDMVPSTKKEKKRFFQRSKDEEEAKEKRAKSGKPEEPEKTREFNLPSAPVSTQIPVEGAPAPAPANSSDIVPLPLPQQ